MLSIGIVGLPNVGKSTLFTALTKKKVEIANYPFATIDPNVGVVEVPDERLQRLANLSHSEKIIPTAIEFVDIAGLVKGANKGEGLGNQFLSHIREVDAVLYVVRAFGGDEIHHVEKSIDPLRDIHIVRDELALKDLDAIARRIEKVAGEARSGSKEAKIQYEFLILLSEALDKGIHAGETLRNKSLNDIEKSILRELQLLTVKPALYVLNIYKKDEVPESVEQFIKEQGGALVTLNIREELDSAGLSAEERVELGLGERKLDEFISAAYTLLQLITFLTTGEQETRAWTVQRGSTAPQAAGVIHTDFEKKFIRAEVINWNILLDAGGWKEAREKGVLRTEGKEYVVQDGDVMYFLHS